MVEATKEEAQRIVEKSRARDEHVAAMEAKLTHLLDQKELEQENKALAA